MRIRKLTTFALTVAVILCAAGLSGAQPSTLKPTGWVNDFANVIDDPTEAKLNKLLTSYEKATSNEVAVVTVPTLNDIPVDDYATRLFEQWEIGKKDKENGLLILVAPTEKKARIEVGYGLEGAINDALTGKIMDAVMIPWFRQGDFSTGILNTATESIRIINEKYNIEFDSSSAAGISSARMRHVKTRKSSIFSKIFKFVIVALLILLFIKHPWAALFILMGMSGGGRGGGFRGSSFGGGGFGGFGGGLSGGGGASRGW